MGSNVDTVKGRLDIVEVVSPYLKLEKAGANLKARCPFHNEKTASFFVSPARQSFYCFGCGAKGDIFTFIEEVEGLEFKEALKFLAEKAGVKLTYDEVVGGESRGEKERLLGVLEAAALYFRDMLEKDQVALGYLKTRGLSKESIKIWQLGYAPAPDDTSWRALYAHLLSLGFAKEVILKAGLAKYKDGKPTGDPYDVFRDRIIFPLADASGRVVGFSGRAISPDSTPKYLNSPDTPVFNKSELLYGLDKAKDSIRRKDYAVLVEGQMDLVLSHQSGVENTVASSGTAFTEAHLARLKRFSNRIILAFDGDAAGEKAAEKSTLLGLALGMEVKIASLPEGKDPADLAKTKPESWKEVLRQSRHAVEHFLLSILDRESDRRKQAKLIERKILPMISLVPSNMEKSHFVSMLSKQTGVKEEMIWEDLKLTKKPEISKVEESSAVPVGRKTIGVPHRGRIERELLGIIFWQGELSGASQPTVDVASLKGEFVGIVGQERFVELESEFLPNKDALVFEVEEHYSDPQRLSQGIVELLDNLRKEILQERRRSSIAELSRLEREKGQVKAEKGPLSKKIDNLNSEINTLNLELQALEERRRIR